MRDGIRHVNTGLPEVAGVRTDEDRKILEARVAGTEHELPWEGFFSDLKERGLRTVDLVFQMVTPVSNLVSGKWSRDPHGRNGKCKSMFLTRK